MVDTYNFYGDKTYFDDLTERIKAYVTEELGYRLKKGKNEEVLLYCTENECKGALRFERCVPQKHLQYYQHGLERMVINWDCYDGSQSDVVEYIERQSFIFSPQEEERLWRYTPLLDKLISDTYQQEDLLEDTMLIFREHSLISVLNVFRVLESMGLLPENAVYYSKGDRCRNIDRIEATFRNKGYAVNVLSAFESTSATGRTEDEVILADSATRVEAELRPYFEKAKNDGMKVVIFDDGGLMVTTVIDLFLEEFGDIMYGIIETTKGGMHAIAAREDMDVTVINLADSVIKNLMSSVIGHSITHQLREMVPHVGFQSKNAVVVGYGELGRTIANDLRSQGMAVYVCETDNIHAYEAVADGYPVSKDLVYLLEHLRPLLVMGCTGRDALTYENLSRIKADTYVATVSSNEIKQSFPKFDKVAKLQFIDNYARIYTLKNGHKLTILGNGASLNLYNGEGAVHADFQPFLAAMIETIAYCSKNGPVKGRKGLDTKLADEILGDAKIIDRYLELTGSLLEARGT